jgi:ribosomal protein S18 acetylase RimI-like enzyme
MDGWVVAETIVIRRALPRDVDGVAALWEKLVAHHHALDSELPAATPRGAIYYGRRIIDRIDDPSACVLVAADGQKIVGYALGFVVDLVPEMFDQEPSGFLADIYVETTHRRRGIGRALVQRMIAWFAEHNLAYWEWHVAALNEEAVAFWKALGGREVMLRMRAPVNGMSGGYA